MTAFAGKDLLVKIDDGTGNFITIAGLRTRQMTFSADVIDVTDQDSPGRWRELLSGVGARHATISGSGVFRTGNSDKALQLGFYAGNIVSLSLSLPTFGVFKGPFCLTALVYKSDHNGVGLFDLTAESAGQINFTSV